MENRWDTKDTVAARVIENMEDPYGQFEGSLATSAAVETEARATLADIGTPMEYSPEVNDPSSGWQIPFPRLRIRRPTIQSDEETKAHINAASDYVLTAVIDRKPNRWDVNGSMTVHPPGAQTTDGIQNIWQPKIGRVLLTVRNTGSNTIYVAPSQDKLRGGSIRGLSIAPNSSYDFATEGGGWCYSPNGSVIDVIDFWYEDKESRPPRYEET